VTTDPTPATDPPRRELRAWIREDILLRIRRFAVDLAGDGRAGNLTPVVEDLFQFALDHGYKPGAGGGGGEGTQ